MTVTKTFRNLLGDSFRIFLLSLTKCAFIKAYHVISWLQPLTYTQTLTEEDVEPALKKFEEHLFTLNVARNVAQELCDSVKETLTGKKHSTFSST